MAEAATRAHVALLAFPFGTHAAPLLALALNLATTSPSTSLFTFFSTPQSLSKLSSSITICSSKATNLRFLPLPENENYSPENLTPMAAIEAFLRGAPSAVREALGQSEPPVSCVIGDSFLVFAEEVAREIGAKWVSFWTAGPCSLAAHFYTKKIREEVKLGDNGIKYENVAGIPALSFIKLKELPEGVIRGDLSSPFPLMLLKMGEQLPQATAVILNCFEDLDPSTLSDLRANMAPCFTIGPLPPIPSPNANPGARDECLAWLDDQSKASVLYVSFGTVKALEAPEVVALAEGLENSARPFLWSMRLEQHELLPDGFDARVGQRGRVVAWAPQAQVLGHDAVGAFLTHCGWNSVLESIIGGVPMICHPFFGDQRINARTVTDLWRIGVTIEGGVLTREGVEGAVHRLMAIEEAQVLRGNVRTLMDLATQATSNEGSSTANLKALVELVVSL
ncbi:hypothetical protein AMTRI_Chr04g243990 [Amborella trichopoda]